MPDTLSTRAARDKSLEFFRVGSSLVNRYLGMTLAGDIADPSKSRFGSFLDSSRSALPDDYFQGLYDSIYSPDEDLTRYVRNGFKRHEFCDAVLARHALSDEDLVGQAKEMLDIRLLDSHSALDRKSYISIKVNHGFWEQMTAGAMRSAGHQTYREFGETPSKRYDSTGFTSLMAETLRQYDSTVLTRGSTGTFVDPDFSFGVSFNAGDYPTVRDLRTPLGPVPRGAVVGCLSFLEAAVPAGRYVVGDGSTAKALVYNRTLAQFLADIQEKSDLIVFIVPTFLRNIVLHGWHGRSETIVVPQGKVHELWPVVLPYIAGAIADAAGQHSRITILAQAAVMTAPVGLLLSLMLEELNTNLHYFDMGQVLNLLVPPDDVPAFLREVGFKRHAAAQEFTEAYMLRSEPRL